MRADDAIAERLAGTAEEAAAVSGIRRDLIHDEIRTWHHRPRKLAPARSSAWPAMAGIGYLFLTVRETRREVEPAKAALPV